MKQVIRIIGGHYRGKKIAFPDSAGLRPTPDRVRETLFNWLMHNIRNARCLDAFAGSGALGLEAFSRGAAEVCLIEQNQPTFKHLQTVISSFKSPQLTLINSNACDFIRQTNQVFDIVFLDPPFDTNLLSTCLTLLYERPILQPGGLVYIESPHAIELPLAQWETLKQKKAGQVVYGLIKKQPKSISFTNYSD